MSRFNEMLARADRRNQEALRRSHASIFDSGDLDADESRRLAAIEERARNRRQITAAWYIPLSALAALTGSSLPRSWRGLMPAVGLVLIGWYWYSFVRDDVVVGDPALLRGLDKELRRASVRNIKAARPSRDDVIRRVELSAARSVVRSRWVMACVAAAPLC